MLFLIKHIRHIRARLGHDKYSAETFDRLLNSMHVKDLHWLINVSAMATALAIILILVVAGGRAS
jgi:hypothetical protein